MEKNKLIIENGDLQSKGRRFAQGLLTLFFWCLWAYMIFPLVSPVVNLMNIEISFTHQLDIELLVSIVIMAVAACISIVVSMLIWRYYNIFLDKKKQFQDAQQPTVLREELAEYFGVNLVDINQWQYAKALHIELSASGNIIDVNVK